MGWFLVEGQLAGWSNDQLGVLLLLCAIGAMISAICSAYSFPAGKADNPAAANSRIRGLISLVAVLALLVGAAWSGMV